MAYELSFECIPPKNRAELYRLGQAMQNLQILKPDFYSVAYGAGGSGSNKTLDTLVYLQKQLPTKMVAHLTAINAKRSDIQQMLDTYLKHDIKELLVLRGDIPTNSTNTSGDFQHANELVSYIKKQYDNKFIITVAAYPECHPESASWQDELYYLQQKIDSGATRAITQYFYNPQAYLQFVDSARQAGINTPIIPGIMPIDNVKSLINFSARCQAEIPRWLLKRLLAYQHQEAALHAFADEFIAQLCNQLLQSGAPGLHFYTINKHPRTLAIVKHLQGMGWTRSALLAS